MFLARRATQAEYFDSPRRSRDEIRKLYECLGRVNRLFGFARAFQIGLPRLVGEARCKSLSILDLGAGDGSLGRALSDSAARRGWSWRFTNLDMNIRGLELAGGSRNVAGTALALPFRDNSFDAVVASQMTHHLSDSETVRHIREAWRVARLGVLLNDLHRNAALYAALWLLLRGDRFPAEFRLDGLLSVKRGWRVPELEALALKAGLPRARVSLYFGARVLLETRKSAPD